MKNKRQLSISFVLSATKTNLALSNREESEVNLKKNRHINKGKIKDNITLLRKPIEELYDEEFGEALDKYNKSQSRKDREISNYYDYVKGRKTTQEQREMIIQVGNVDDIKENRLSPEEGRELLEGWYEHFEERNPNLKVHNAVIHMDTSTPRLHVNFVPIGRDYKRGMDKQVAFNRALSQQGGELDKPRPFPEWRDREVRVMEELMALRGMGRKKVGSYASMSLESYKELKARERAVDKRENALVKNEAKLAEMENTFEAIKIEIYKSFDDIEITQEKMNRVQEEIEANQNKQIEVMYEIEDIIDEEYRVLDGYTKGEDGLMNHLLTVVEAADYLEMVENYINSLDEDLKTLNNALSVLDKDLEALWSKSDELDQELERFWKYLDEKGMELDIFDLDFNE